MRKVGKTMAKLINLHNYSRDGVLSDNIVLVDRRTKCGYCEIID